MGDYAILLWFCAATLVVVAIVVACVVLLSPRCPKCGSKTFVDEQENWTRVGPDDGLPERLPAAVKCLRCGHRAPRKMRKDLPWWVTGPD